MRDHAMALLLMAACGSAPSTPGQAGPDAGPGPDAAPIRCTTSTPISFKTDVAPLINHCGGGELCHGTSPTWPYTSLVSIAAIECSDDRRLVKPGDPADSYLIQKLSGTDMCSGTRMPRLATPLSDANMQKIVAWICQDAPNN